VASFAFCGCGLRVLQLETWLNRTNLTLCFYRIWLEAVNIKLQAFLHDKELVAWAGHFHFGSSCPATSNMTFILQQCIQAKLLRYRCRPSAR